MRRHPRRAQVDPTHPQAWGSSDRNGMVGNLANMRWQHEYRGSRLTNTRILVHEDELDTPQRQLGAPAILGPDPVPVANARPENYSIDEYPVSTRYTLNGKVLAMLPLTPYPRNRIALVQGGAPDKWNGP